MKTLAVVVALVAIACAKEKSATDPAPAAAKTQQAETETTKTEAAETAMSCDSPSSDCGGEKEAGGCNKWDDEAAAVASRDVPDNAVWKTLKVSGMTCGGCERRVIAHVGKLDGVVSVEADSELGEVRVAMNDATGETARAAAAEITRLGYNVAE